MTNEPEWEKEFGEKLQHYLCHLEQFDIMNQYPTDTQQYRDALQRDRENLKDEYQSLKAFIKEEKEKSYRDGYKKGAISSDDVAFHIEREKSELLSKIEEEVQERRGVCKSMAEQTAQDGFALEVLAILSKYKV